MNPIAPFTVALAVLCATATAPAAAGGTPSSTLEGCVERFANVTGDEPEVRARVPAGYELVRDTASGRPLVWVSSIRCDKVTVDDASGPATIAAFAAVIESPDGSGCLSRVPVASATRPDALPLCNLYVFFHATDAPHYAAFLRAGTPDYPVSLVRGLSFEDGPFDAAALGTRFRFRADKPTPSPFVVEFVVRDRPGDLPLTPSFWRDTDAGTAKLTFVSDNLTLGEAHGVVRPRAGSEMAAMIGGTSATPPPGFALFGAPRWRSGVLTKSIVRDTQTGGR